MSDLTTKDAEQDSKLAVLESRVESFRERVYSLEGFAKSAPKGEDLDMLYSHIDKLETKIKELDNELRGRIRKLEVWVGGAAAVIAAATFIIGIIASVESKEVNYGSHDPTQQKELLQLPSGRN